MPLSQVAVNMPRKWLHPPGMSVGSIPSFTTSTLNASLSSLSSLLVRKRSKPLPTLPNALSPEQLAERQDELLRNQAIYIYESPVTIPGVAFIQGPVSNLPDQSPSFHWRFKVACIAVRVLLNSGPRSIFGVLTTLMRALTSDPTDDNAMANTAKYFRVPKEQLTDTVRSDFASSCKRETNFEERTALLAPYRDMFRWLKPPVISNNFLEDAIFCRLRVAGYNPLSLFRVFSLDQMPFPISDDRLPNLVDTVAKAIAEKRLYALDYSFLKGVKQSEISQKICYPAKALFVIPPGGGRLQAVAIQLPQETVYPTRSNARFSSKWAIAKLTVNIADAMHHELKAHLGRTHLLIEPFVAATMRQLPSQHPLHMLLRPHFEGTVFINDTASRRLVSPGGDVDRIFAGDIQSIMEWCAEEVRYNRFNASMPDVEVKERGIDDPILEMPYRDDALEHFDALHEWVLGYISAFYESDEDVSNDIELQRWVDELMDPNKGRVRDFGDNGDGKVHTRAYLIRAVTHIIFTASVQHAAVNFPQKVIMAYSPAVAGALWSPIPEPGKACGLEQWLSSLTPLPIAMEHVEILSVIGSVHYTKLGRYRSGELPFVKEVYMALKQYQKRLAIIDERIRQREKVQSLKYEYLRPDRIPQSINI